MSRLRCLQDFVANALDAVVECKGCGRRVRSDPRELFKGQKVKWQHNLILQAGRMRCAECGHRGARIAPIPKIVGPLDCAEFQADIAAMWERVMAEEAEQGALFEIEGPDEDGCVWICSAEGRDVWCQNLGPTDVAAEVLSQWLGSIDYQERA